MELKEVQREYEMVAAGKEYIKMDQEEEAAVENVSSEEENSEKETEPTETKEKEKFHVGYFAKKIKSKV